VICGLVSLVSALLYARPVILSIINMTSPPSSTERSIQVDRIRYEVLEKGPRVLARRLATVPLLFRVQDPSNLTEEKSLCGCNGLWATKFAREFASAIRQGADPAMALTAALSPQAMEKMKQPEYILSHLDWGREASHWISATSSWVWALAESYRQCPDVRSENNRARILVIDPQRIPHAHDRDAGRTMYYAEELIGDTAKGKERLCSNAAEEVLIYGHIPAAAILGTVSLNNDSFIATLPTYFFTPPDGLSENSRTVDNLNMPILQGSWYSRLYFEFVSRALHALGTCLHSRGVYAAEMAIVWLRYPWPDERLQISEQHIQTLAETIVKALHNFSRRPLAWQTVTMAIQARIEDMQTYKALRRPWEPRKPARETIQRLIAAIEAEEMASSSPAVSSGDNLPPDLVQAMSALGVN